METSHKRSSMSREAMKLALEALEDANDVARMEFSDEDYYSEAINALRQALETKQEPVAWMHNFITNNVITHIPADIGRHPERWTPLYTAPPKKEWVGLTLNEAEEFYDKYTDRAELINAIDKFLEEKNT